MRKILLLISMLLLAGCGDDAPSNVTESLSKKNTTMEFMSGPLSPEGKFTDLSDKAAAGSAKDQLGLARRYYIGDGTAQDFAKAAEWYEKAAEQGSDFAQYKLAVMYDQGEGVAKDPAKAIYWWKKAAEQNNTDARDELKKRGAE